MVAFVSSFWLLQNRSAAEIGRLLRREVGKPWAGRSIHEISKGDVVDVVSAIERRGAPVAANKTLKSIKTFLRWCENRTRAGGLRYSLHWRRRSFLLRPVIFSCIKLWLDRCDNICCLLQRENVRELAVITLRPNLVTGHRIN